MTAFIERQVQRLLSQAEEALDRLDWAEVEARAEAVLRLDPQNADALALQAATSRDSHEGEAGPEREPHAHPRSFADGRYQVTRFLGEGATKRVYLAHDAKLDRDVAFALIKTEGLDAEGLTRIRREAQSMARLGDHPHIVSVFDIGEEAGQPYLVSQFMAGGDVERLLAESPERRVPLEQAVKIGEEVCQALEHAHSQGVIHRDLKPGNVWLSAGPTATGDPNADLSSGSGPREIGTAKLGDFGLAVALDRSRLTQAGMMVGTVAYMAPEQALGGEVTPRSDLYSLGCLLYELVTGRPPFVGDESVAIITQHLNTPPVAPSWHTPAVSTGLEGSILRLLEKDPAKRPGSAAEVRQMLASAVTSPSPPVSPPPGTGKGVTYPPPAAEGALAWGAAEGEGAPSASSPNPLYQRTFVGREHELRQLQTAFDAALSGHGGLAMVVGEPGIGKTALCEQLATYVAVRGGKTLVGHCYEEGSLSLPYLAFVEALRSYVLSREPDDLKADLGTGAADVARIVSEVRDRVQVELRPAGDPEDDRWRLLQAVVGFLRNAAAVQPIVLVLEDLHWADRGTLDLLLHLARNLEGGRLLVVGTYRDVEVDRAHPLSGSLADLRRTGNLLRVPLRGLTVDDVHRMYCLVRGQEVNWSAAEAVHRQTEGNPLFVQEVLRYLVEEGLVVREGGRYVRSDDRPPEMIVPEGLREVVGKRLSRLSPECNRLLAIAAVIGRDFRLDTLQAVSGPSLRQSSGPAGSPNAARERGLESEHRTGQGPAEDELFSALEEATRVGVLEEQARLGTIAYRFAHAFFRQTLYEELSAPRRLRLHQEVARALEAQYGARLEEHAVELAEHFSQSTDAADLEKALRYGELAATRAMGVYAYGEAARHLEGALEVLEVVDPDDKARRADLLLALGEALMPAGDPRRVFEEVAETAFALAAELGDESRAGRVCMQALSALPRFGGAGILRTEVGKLWVQRADAHAEPDTLSRVFADAALSWAVESSQAAQEASQRALELARRLGDAGALFRVATYAMFGPPELTLERAQLAREVARWPRGGASPRDVATSLEMSADYLVALGDRSEAERLWQEVQELAARTQDVGIRVSAHRSQIEAPMMDGRLEAAAEGFAETIALGEALGSPILGRDYAVRYGWRVFVYLGGRTDALSALDAWTQGLGSIEESIVRSLLRVNCLASLGRFEEAARSLGELLEAGRIGAEDAYARAFDLALLLEAATALEDRSLVAKLVPRLAPLSGLSWLPNFLSTPARHLGAAAVLLGELDRASAYYEQALEAAGRIRFRPEVALTRLQLAELLLEHYPEERPAAVEHLDFAIEEFRDMRMAPSLERALQLRETIAG